MGFVLIQGLINFPIVVRVMQYEDQTEEQAFAIHEAENGPIGKNNSILRVVIRKPGPSCA